MFFSFFLGFLAGVVSLLALVVCLFLYALGWIERQNKNTEDSMANRQNRDLFVDSTIDFPCQKQGLVWILEREKNSKVNTDGATGSGPKEKKEKTNIVEVSAVKRHARINYHSLILTDAGGSSATIDLSSCTVVSVSSSNYPSRKWAKRYPIKIQSKDASAELYNGNNTVYIYADTSWEKESWCKALRLASTANPNKLHSHLKIIQNYQKYLEAIVTEYPSFMKQVSGSPEQLDCANRAEGQSRVRTFFKKFSKRTSKMAIERTSSDSLTISPEAGIFFEDEGRLCLNLLLSRLFFDAQNSTEISNLIQSRIQSNLSGLRTPSYIGEITCTGFSLGKLPPHIHKIRAVPVDLTEMLAFEVDVDFKGNFSVSVETRLDIHAAELHKDLFEKGPESDSCSGSNSGSGSVSGSEDEASDLLENLEHYRRQCRSAYDLAPTQSEAEVEAVSLDGLKHSKSTNVRTSTYSSRWKNMLNSIATRVNQVPLSLVIRVNSIRGTLRFHIKPPPSDRLWYGFTSMPDINWNIETSIAEHKIASRNIASLLKNRFKASLFGTMVLPNCESTSIPGMLSEKDDWAPRKTAPFMRVNHESTPETTKLHEEPKPVTPLVTVTSVTSTTVKSEAISPIDEKVEFEKGMALAQEHKGAVLEPSTSCPYGTPTRDLRLPLLSLQKQGSGSGSTSSESMVGSPINRWNSTSDLSATNGEDAQAKKANRRARMMDFGKRMGDKLGENRRRFEEKGRSFVEKFRENMNTVQ
ncbi:Testis-expressed sequence 2 protein [Rhynchospora pubera]|uniref:Testis-expressed sequence 2 protein n=1 Tax=Rhynchospora pubera TaxID=906938 RepID=A0AAV8EAD5_9POAL|nr:Testis-expressed sequence 2 protein [Rhynchospora pubera]